jgi:polyhydroxyalkanoate synthesis regulator phasin
MRRVNLFDMPQNPLHTLDEVIKIHQETVKKLHAEFTAKCDEATAEAEKNLEELPEEDQETRQELADEHEQHLKQITSDFTMKINRANLELTHAVEQISKNKENEQLAEIDQLMATL